MRKLEELKKLWNEAIVHRGTITHSHHSTFELAEAIENMLPKLIAVAEAAKSVRDECWCQVNNPDETSLYKALAALEADE